jgi:hypothetical protein
VQKWGLLCEHFQREGGCKGRGRICLLQYSDVSPRKEEEPEGREEGGWWTPDPSWLEPEEEDEEEISNLNKILSGGQEEREVNRATAPSPQDKGECNTPQDVRDEGKRDMEKEVAEKTRKRRRPRRKTMRSTEEEWEALRKDAWLRELLSSSSEDEEGAGGKRGKTGGYT